MLKNIVSFGEVMMRLQVSDNDLLTQSNTLKYTFSGTGVNFTSAITKLGHKGTLVTRLPTNVIGEAALSFIRGLGIKDTYIAQGGHYMGMYFLENGFGYRPSRITYTNRRESSFNMSSLKDYELDAIAAEADIIHFCGISLAMNDQIRQIMKTLAENVKKKGGTVCFDCNYRPSLWKNGYEEAKSHYEDMLGLSDIVMMNENDAINILGLNTTQKTRKAQLEELIPLVAQRYDIHSIAGTHREVKHSNKQSLRGFIFKDNKFAFSNDISFSVHDRIGTGDAFTSGIIHGEVKEYSLEETVTFAHAASILAHTISGDTPLSTEEEIRNYMLSSSVDVYR